MRKVLMILAFASASVATMAQEEPTLKHSVATNSFWSNWFIQAGANWNVWYAGGDAEHGNGLPASPFENFRSNPGVALSLGKWFTPGMGLRVKGQGLWGRIVRASYGQKTTQPYSKGFKYWILNGQAMFNLSNMLCGYNEKRVFNVIPFAGAGIGRTMTHNLYAMDLSAGLQLQFRVAKHLAIHVEAGWNRLENDIDGGYDYYGDRGWESHTNNVYAELGLTFNLGKSTWNKVPDVDAIKANYNDTINNLKSQLDDLNNENARLQKMLRDAQNKKPEVTVMTESIRDFVTHPISVFFDLGKINVANLKDLVNVKGLAKYAVANNSKLLVIGYADSSTGTPEINARLSKERAQTVTNELIKLGVNPNNIRQDYKGGVTELGVDSPVSFDRRATVQITDEE